VDVRILYPGVRLADQAAGSGDGNYVLVQTTETAENGFPRSPDGSMAASPRSPRTFSTFPGDRVGDIQEAMKKVAAAGARCWAARSPGSRTTSPASACTRPSSTPKATAWACCSQGHGGRPNERPQGKDHASLVVRQGGQGGGELYTRPSPPRPDEDQEHVTIHDTPSVRRTSSPSSCWAGVHAAQRGPYFKFTPAVSFLVACRTKEEVQGLWTSWARGKVLMELGAYPSARNTAGPRTATGCPGR